MTRLNVVELRQSLADVMNRVEHRGERIIIHRRGKDTAAIIPVEDLHLFERLLAEMEDKIDVAAAQAALAEPGELVAYDEAVRDLQRKKFWADFNARCEALQADPEAWAGLRQEDAAWKATLADGLEEERRSDGRQKRRRKPGTR